MTIPAYNAVIDTSVSYSFLLCWWWNVFVAGNRWPASSDYSTASSLWLDGMFNIYKVQVTSSVLALVCPVMLFKSSLFFPPPYWIQYSETGVLRVQRSIIYFFINLSCNFFSRYHKSTRVPTFSKPFLGRIVPSWMIISYFLVFAMSVVIDRKIQSIKSIQSYGSGVENISGIERNSLCLFWHWWKTKTVFD